jgi:hypothetical protein
VGVILVDGEKALKAGITKGHVKTPQKEGGEYFVNVEVFHQLHCLVRRPTCCKQLFFVADIYYRIFFARQIIGIMIIIEHLASTNLKTKINSSRYMQVKSQSLVNKYDRIWAN